MTHRAENAAKISEVVRRQVQRIVLRWKRVQALSLVPRVTQYVLDAVSGVSGNSLPVALGRDRQMQKFGDELPVSHQWVDRVSWCFSKQFKWCDQQWNV